MANNMKWNNLSNGLTEIYKHIHPHRRYIYMIYILLFFCRVYACLILFYMFPPWDVYLNLGRFAQLRPGDKGLKDCSVNSSMHLPQHKHCILLDIFLQNPKTLIPATVVSSRFQWISPGEILWRHRTTSDRKVLQFSDQLRFYHLCCCREKRTLWSSCWQTGSS